MSERTNQPLRRRRTGLIAPAATRDGECSSARVRLSFFHIPHSSFFTLILLFESWLLFSATLVVPPPLWALTSGDYFLHSTTSDFLNTISPTALTAKVKDSPAVNRTTF